MVVSNVQEIFERQQADGRYVYTDTQVRDVLPALFLLSGLDLSEAEGAMKHLLVEFCEKAGTTLESGRDEVARKVAAYYRSHPPEPSLLRELQRACA